MIKSFRDKLTEEVFGGSYPPKKLDKKLAATALRRLMQLDNAESLDDLAYLPGLRLHKLGGDRKEYFAIAVNMQWRICFIWRDNHAHNVELVDYH